jgi:hypothetical protein
VELLGVFVHECSLARDAHIRSVADALAKAELAAENGDVDGAHQLQVQAEAYNKQHDEMLKRLQVGGSLPACMQESWWILPTCAVPGAAEGV